MAANDKKAATVNVTVLSPVKVGGRRREPGAPLAVAPDLAAELIAAGLAEGYKQPASAPAGDPLTSQTA